MARIGFGILLLVGCLCCLSAPREASAQKKKGKGVQPIYTTLRLNQAVYKTWSMLLEQSGLSKIYQNTEPIVTMFAPTEDAFVNVKRDDLDDLIKSKAKLIRFITYHTVEGEIIELEELEKKTKIMNTLLQPLAIKKEEAATKINDVKIVQSDVAAVNGTVHGIDGFLVPIGK